MVRCQESLSGRIGLLTLLVFSLREKYGAEDDTPFIPTYEYFAERKKTYKRYKLFLC